ncbi:uncharacterized protein DUF2490 [Winogradskyella epiphytica]|uniref:Uncharacterized protein DUF2490 n=1 Tax=Winogradskyella epiphytica TaxID=262005 RepID=A0A2V4XHI5_9FLAO|nr:DUF2490 domain-containing protein [Winogradskyella epiphytica]PYE82750.1 uncharacterized protein DUF2490 [Winogradskyella epiphytica]GGW53342.1 hypothetical protein GCM10008085_00540 [Winogradskyella epiphytica]
MLAQTNYSVLFEPEISLGYDVTSRYSHSFGIENRNLVFNDSDLKFEIKHIELAHTSTYALNSLQNIGLGIQFRFKENFDTIKENEFRLLQEYKWKNSGEYLDIAQRIRTEQRFYTSITTFRTRYELGLSFPLQRIKPHTHKTNISQTYIKTEMESLLEVAKTQKPKYEQRFSALFGCLLHVKTGFEIGFQYRLADYTQNIEHELFIVTGIDIHL